MSGSFTNRGRKPYSSLVRGHCTGFVRMMESSKASRQFSSHWPGRRGKMILLVGDLVSVKVFRLIPNGKEPPR